MTQPSFKSQLSFRIVWSSLGAVCMACAATFTLAAMPVPASAQTVARALPDFTDLVEKTGPAVVHIRTTERTRAGLQGQIPGLDENDPLYEFFRRLLPPDRQRQGPRGSEPDGGEPDVEVPRGIGSGFLVSADGYLMTNAHVVRGAQTVTVTLTDRREFKARVIGTDQRTDVAVLKVDATGLPHVTIGSVDDIKPGQWVLAIGSPFGLDNSVTAGIVSARARETGEYLPFIQTDVAVNPGNSGGPLLNLKGEVVGINSQIYSRTGGFMGISFAIPIDEAMRVAEQLRSTGHVMRGRIGVRIDEIGKDTAAALGIKQTGVLVRSVERDGPAERAGLEAGDIILKWQGRAMERQSDLPRAVGNTRPGTQATVQLWRKGQVRDVSIVVAEAESDRSGTAPSPAPAEKTKPAPKANALGLVVGELPAARKSELRLRTGVLVESAEGAAARVGIRAGDIIVTINNVEAVTPRQFDDAVAKAEHAKPLVLLVLRGEVAQYVTVPLTGGNGK